MFELYNDSLRDLLANPGNEHEKLKIKLAEHSDSGMVEVDGAVHEKVECMDDLLKLFDRGARNRTTSSTNMNADSLGNNNLFIIYFICNLIYHCFGYIL